MVSGDKMDNSKRINYGFDINNENIKLQLFQSYEFTANTILIQVLIILVIF